VHPAWAAPIAKSSVRKPFPVGIAGVLAAAALPNFARFQARSKQSEAKVNLKAMFTAQRAFQAASDRHADVLERIRRHADVLERIRRHAASGGRAAARDE
jgi:type IV pilus assembly protein PilA